MVVGKFAPIMCNANLKLDILNAMGPEKFLTTTCSYTFEQSQKQAPLWPI